jgi:hypothetical protein
MNSIHIKPKNKFILYINVFHSVVYSILFFVLWYLAKYNFSFIVSITYFLYLINGIYRIFNIKRININEIVKDFISIINLIVHLSILMWFIFIIILKYIINIDYVLLAYAFALCEIIYIFYIVKFRYFTKNSPLKSNRS